MAQREKPNILLTGTPGTGKTTTAEAIARETGLTHFEISRLVREKELHEGFDEERQCFIVDDDKVCDEIEDALDAGGVIVDSHTIDYFPKRWFDAVIVLRTDNSVLYSRLEQRGYPDAKIRENIECEIFQVLLDEARDCYDPDIVIERTSNTLDDFEENVEFVKNWIEQWTPE